MMELYPDYREKWLSDKEKDQNYFSSFSFVYEDLLF